MTGKKTAGTGAPSPGRPKGAEGRGGLAEPEVLRGSAASRAKAPPGAAGSAGLAECIHP